MSGHTPGPWAQNGTHGHRFIGPANNEEGCVAIACKVEGHHGCEEMMANAVLIAAAPDLLAALESFPGFDTGSGKYEREWLTKLTAAIARAKGEL